MVNLKTKIVGEMPKRLPQPGNPGDVDGPAQLSVTSLRAEVTFPFRYLSNFLRSFHLTLINCEVELDLSKAKNCVLKEYHNITSVDFKITST